MDLSRIIEALLFSSQKPLTAAEIRELLTAAAGEPEAEESVRAFRKVKVAEVAGALELLATEVEGWGRSFRLVCVAGAWQLVTRPEYGAWVRSLLGLKARPPRLSQPALETLAIVAYRQPTTRAEIEQIRGVSVDGVIQTLTDRGLIEVNGRAEVVGRPATYGTTAAFLEYFGLRSLEELPVADELRRLPVQRPEALVTAEPGLATAPPEELAQGQALLALDAAGPSSGLEATSPEAPTAPEVPSPNPVSTDGTPSAAPA